jgi:hypothetical protein
LIPEEAIRAAAFPIGRPVRRRRRRSRGDTPDVVRKTGEGLEIVKLGLGFHYARLIGLSAAMVVMLVSLMALAAGLAIGSRGLLGLSNGALVILLIILWILPLLGLTGSILCLWVPRQTKALSMVVSSLTLDGAQFPFVLVLTVANLGPVGFTIILMLGFLLGVAAWVFFMVFLAFLGQYLEEPHMADEAYRLLQRGIVILVSYLAMQIVFRAIVAGMIGSQEDKPPETHILFLFWVLFSVILLITTLWVIIIVKFLFEIIALIGSLRQVILSRW